VVKLGLAQTLTAATGIAKLQHQTGIKMKIVMRVLGVVLGLLVLAVGGLGFYAYAPDIPRDELIAEYGSEASQFVVLESGVTVHLRDEGCQSCDAIFLIHGSNASLHTWEPWVDFLSENWRVVSLDLPGHGLTGPTDEGNYTIHRAADVIEEVRHYLDINRFHLAGNSRGGSVSLRYAVDHPERVQSLALLDAVGAPWPTAEVDEDIPFIYVLMANETIANMLKNFITTDLIREALLDAFSNPDAVTEEMVERYFEIGRYPGTRETVLIRARMEYVTDAFEPSHALTMPVMVMWGEDDNLVPLAMADAFMEAMPHAQLVTYPGVGHAPMEEIPAQSATDYQIFLDNIAPSTPVSTAVVHQNGQALFGYYMAAGESEIRIGDWVLSHLFIDDAFNVDAWEVESSQDFFAPVMFEIVDTSSAWIEGEIGGAYENSTRGLPTHFAITQDRVEFSGFAEHLGEITFSGSYDRAGVMAAYDIGATEDVVITGRLQIGEHVFEEARFSWFAGD
jgi:pimeloyl-ACP methyl ester carboxylesterase